MKIGYVNQILPIELQLDDAMGGKYPRVRIFRGVDNFLLDDLAMPLGTVYGTYKVNYTPTVTGHIYMVFQVYTSNLYNVLDEYVTTNDNALIQDPALSEQNIAQDVWTYATRSLTTPVEIVGVPDASLLATKQDVIDAKNEIIMNLDTWEVKGTISVDPVADSLLMVSWLTKNGETVLDANSSVIELRDQDDALVYAGTLDNTISASAGLFKFTRSSASAIIFKNRTYVMKISITRGLNTYLGNVSISTF
jgi:hypothetical protein